MIRVLVVEDEQVAAEAHRRYVERLAGFTVAGVVRSGGDALRFLAAHGCDLVLLDLYLPDLHGLEVCRAIRGAGHPVDVIAVTSARDLTVVRRAVSVGVVQYLLKPFTFAMLRDKLERYARYRDSLDTSGQAGSQDDVDRAFAALRGTSGSGLPKGMTAGTLNAVVAALRADERGHSAAEVGATVGVSRVTSRRYLEHLADNGLADRTQHYGGTGRPEFRYRWSADR